MQKPQVTKTNTTTGAIPFSRPQRRDLNRVIRFKSFLQNTILDALKGRGWQEVQEGSDDWDLYWVDVGSMKELFDHGYFEEHMRINHFRNHYELTRKDMMVKNLKRYRKQLEKENPKEAAKCDFFPTTFVLPSEYHMFVEEFKRKPGTIWIMKPAGRAQGKGIFLFNELKDITEWKKGEAKPNNQPNDPNKEGIVPEIYVVQRYVDNPLLIGGKKFDMRIYLLVTSFNPLKAYLYREGFARLSSTRFSLDSIKDTFVHITNNAIQKQAPNYDPDKGAKWCMQNLRQYLIAKHGIEAVENMFKLMDDIFIKSVQCVQKTIINDKHCFELYGYDILLDANLKPYLLEINASPALTASSQDDYELKVRLLDDMLSIVDMECRLTGREKRVGGFDMIWNDGPVFADEAGLEQQKLNSFLGCMNDRDEQLKKLYRQLAINKKTQAS